MSWSAAPEVTAAADAAEVEPTPAAAATLFGDRIGLAERYAALLLGPGTVRGLLGPREGTRIWTRHVLNCAVVAELVPAGAAIADLGSGAGLPGIVLAIARPDLTVTLVEPMARRAEFLTEAVDLLGLEGVKVQRCRAEDLVRTDRGRFDVVTARAVTDLLTLSGWSRPLVRRGGVLLAMKGARAEEELAAARPALARAGMVADVRVAGDGVLVDPTTVVAVRFP